MQRPAISQGAAKGLKQAFADVVLTGITWPVPCSVQPASASTREAYAQNGMFVDSTLYFVQDLQARPNDMILATNLRTGQLYYFKVKGFDIGLFVRGWVPYFCHCERQV